MSECFLTGLAGYCDYIDEAGNKYTVCKEIHDTALKLVEKYPDTTLNDALTVVIVELWGNASKKYGVIGEKKKSKWGFNFFKKVDDGQ